MTVFPWRIAEGGMKNKVLVPWGMRLPIPCASRPRSLANAVVQTALSNPEDSWRYFMGKPVSGLMKELRRASFVCV